VAVVYATGVRLLDQRGSRRRPPVTAQSAFYAGLIITVAAVVSPLHGWSEALFAAHMTQHLLLVLVAAPLIVIGRPAAPLIAGLPRRVGKNASQLVSGVRKRVAFLLHPVTIWALHAFVLWAWHLPTLYNAALTNPMLHGLEHVTFLGTALLVWSAIFGERPIGEGASVLLLFATGLQSAALGALLALSTTVIYDVHATAAPAAGIDPLTDQQLAGAIMWIPPGIIYMVITAFILARLLRNAGPRLEEAGS